MSYLRARKNPSPDSRARLDVTSAWKHNVHQLELIDGAVE
jgi:hypothetical protein